MEVSGQVGHFPYLRFLIRLQRESRLDQAGRPNTRTAELYVVDGSRYGNFQSKWSGSDN